MILQNSPQSQKTQERAISLLVEEKIQLFMEQVFFILTNSEYSSNIWYRENSKLFVNRSTFVNSFIDNSKTITSIEDFHILIVLLITYFNENDVIKIVDNSCTINRIISNLLNWNFSFIEYLLRIKVFDFENTKNVEEKKLICVEYKEILNIIFHILKLISKNNEVTKQFDDFFKQVDKFNDTLISKITNRAHKRRCKDYPDQKEPCNKYIWFEDRRKKSERREDRNQHCEFFTWIFYEISDQINFLSAYFWDKVFYLWVYELANSSVNKYQWVRELKFEINKFFKKEEWIINAAISWFSEDDIPWNNKLLILKKIKTLLITKMILDRFYIYEISQSFYSAPNIWHLSIKDTFDLTEEEENNKQYSLKLLITFYNQKWRCKCDNNTDVIKNFCNKLDNDEQGIEELTSIIYYIIFYNNNIDKSLIIILNNKLMDKMINWVSFFLETQFRNIIHIQSHKLEYIYRIKEKYRVSYNDLNKKAILDSLTGTFNRNALNDQIIPKIKGDIKRKDHENAKNSDNNLILTTYVCIFIDLDHFKNINDTLWHAVWDLTLKEFVKIMEDILREEDYLVRLWWDEFLVITEIWWKTAVEKLNILVKICKKINDVVRYWLNEAYFMNVSNNNPVAKWKKVTASIWTSFYTINDNWDDTSERADVAVYESKNKDNPLNWRDRFTIHEKMMMFDNT